MSSQKKLLCPFQMNKLRMGLMSNSKKLSNAQGARRPTVGRSDSFDVFWQWSQIGQVTLKIYVIYGLWQHKKLESGRLRPDHGPSSSRLLFIVMQYNRSQVTIGWQKGHCRLTSRWSTDSRQTLNQSPNPANSERCKKVQLCFFDAKMFSQQEHQLKLNKTSANCRPTSKN